MRRIRGFRCDLLCVFLFKLATSQSGFYDVYVKNQPNAVNIPWYTMAGNHDYYGNITGQLAHRSDQWFFPSLSYNFTYVIGRGRNRSTVDFIVFDTMEICGNTIDTLNGSFAKMISSGKGKQPPGPRDPAKAAAALRWLEDKLAASQ